MPVSTINVPLNRVEWDLEIQIKVEDGIVSDAWCSGTMYRGFEKILKGRSALDGLVITPRICGICNTSHLAAASKALDMLTHANVPPDAVRVRNIAQMTEHIQSDVRHGLLMFAVDFVNPAYKANPLFEEAVRRYEPFKGTSIIETIRETKRVLEIVAILGGQWPHSSFMVPGGIVSVPSRNDMLQCALILKKYRTWYEHKVLGCSIERWREVRTEADIDLWFKEKAEHREGELGFYIRFARSIGLEKTGKGCGSYLSFGALERPKDTGLPASSDNHFVPSGFSHAWKLSAFDQTKVAEHVAHSWYYDYEGGRHPFEGITKPYASGKESGKYSWAKAPRYDNYPAETGPLAEMIIVGHPLIASFY